MIVLGLCQPDLCRLHALPPRDIKRLFAYSSIEHMGIITFAFGMGGAARELRRPAAHDHAFSLTKSAIFFAVGHIAQVKGTQRLADIQGLSASAIRCWPSASPWAWSPSPACRHSACSPREFMLLTSTFARRAAGSPCCRAFGLLIGVRRTARLRLSGTMLFGEPSGAGPASVEATRTRRWSCISRWYWRRASSAAAEPVVRWFQRVAVSCG